MCLKVMYRLTWAVSSKKMTEWTVLQCEKVRNNTLMKWPIRMFSAVISWSSKWLCSPFCESSPRIYVRSGAVEMPSLLSLVNTTPGDTLLGVPSFLTRNAEGLARYWSTVETESGWEFLPYFLTRNAGRGLPRYCSAVETEWLGVPSFLPSWREMQEEVYPDTVAQWRQSGWEFLPSFLPDAKCRKRFTPIL